jgi:hypothetical protein
MTDEGGVLGNLPNSRPGTRSAKRDRPAREGRTTAAKGGTSGDRVRVFDDMDQKGGHDSARAAGDPLNAVVRGGAGLAMTGVKAAAAVTQELLRRLPRP